MATSINKDLAEKRQPRQYSAAWLFWGLVVTAVICYLVGTANGYTGWWPFGWFTLPVIILVIFLWVLFTTYVVDRDRSQKTLRKSRWWLWLRRPKVTEETEEAEEAETADSEAPLEQPSDDVWREFLILRAQFDNDLGKTYQAHWDAGVHQAFLGMDDKPMFDSTKQEEARSKGYAAAVRVANEGKARATATTVGNGEARASEAKPVEEES